MSESEAPDDDALIAALKSDMLNGPDEALAERVKTRLGQSLALGAAWSASTVAKSAAAASAKGAASLASGAVTAGAAAQLASAGTTSALASAAGTAGTFAAQPLLVFLGALLVGGGMTLGISSMAPSTAVTSPALPSAAASQTRPRAARAAQPPQRAPVEVEAPSPPSMDAPEKRREASSPARSPASLSGASTPTRGASSVEQPPLASSSLAQQQVLLDTARRALARGDASGSLEALAWHRSRFPQTELAEERAALTIKALRAAGRNAESAAEAKRFAEQYPRSVFSPGLQDGGAIP